MFPTLERDVVLHSMLIDSIMETLGDHPFFASLQSLLYTQNIKDSTKDGSVHGFLKIRMLIVFVSEVI